MVFYLAKYLLFYILCTNSAPRNSIATQDQTSTRANTLLDDADDIQKQLNYEARERLGRPKTVWVFHLPTQLTDFNTAIPSSYYRYNTQKYKSKKAIYKKDLSSWDYKDQRKWHLQYSECGGKSQSPVDIPKDGLVRAKNGRRLIFANYDKPPQELYVINDGTRVRVSGSWDRKDQPLIYGGAAHSRRYLFHSLTLHWPSEHRVGGLQYPLEVQVLHVSADYKSFEEALDAVSKDRLAFLGIVNLYMYKNHTQSGIEEIIRGLTMEGFNSSIYPYALSYFNPPFKRYACYQGSLTVPPCSETVLWLIRDKTLPITRNAVCILQKALREDFKGSLLRDTQPLNDRKVFLFN